MDDNVLIFNTFVWEELEKIKDDSVLREFITVAKESLSGYETNGGTFPTIEYLIGVARDKVNMKKSIIKDSISDKKDRVRQSWIDKYK